MNENELRRLYHIIEARKSFRYFVDHIFSQSVDILEDGKWTGGKFIDDICDWYQDNPLTIRISARNHFKSMSFYAYIMWLLFRNDERSIEIQYFSYNYKMASYHTGKIKTAIEVNPFFDDIKDKKANAESIIGYTWDGNHEFTVTPRGLLEFKRGIHAPIIFVDDPLQDPDNKLIPTKIDKINDIMRTQILDMFQNELHITGTPQTNTDFFFDPNFTKRFSTKILPAIINDETKEVLWPEWMTYDELMLRKSERGEKQFNQEYLCSPVYSEEAFVSPEKYDACVNMDLKNYDELIGIEPNADHDYIGGFDIGKKTHPSHFVLFEIIDGVAVQRVSKWMNNWEYIDQIDYVQTAIDTFGAYIVKFDATRGEFEALDEQGKLPAEMDPVNFTHKRKHSLATNMDRMIGEKRVQFLDDKRQRSQTLVVNNDLKAPETHEGHGDSFWSICLALIELENAEVGLTVI